MTTTANPHVVDRGTLLRVQWAVLSGGAGGLCSYMLLPDRHPWANPDTDLPESVASRTTRAPAEDHMVTIRVRAARAATAKEARSEIIGLIKQADEALTDVVIP